MEKLTEDFHQQFRKVSKKVTDKTSKLGQSLRVVIAQGTSKNMGLQIKLTRKIIESSQINFEEFNRFFNEINIDYSYKAIQQIFYLMTFTINSISHLFLASIKDDKFMPLPSRIVAEVEEEVRPLASEQEWNQVKLQQELKFEPLKFDEILCKTFQEFGQSQTTTLLTELLQHNTKLSQQSKKYGQLITQFQDLTTIKNSTQISEDLLKLFSQKSKQKLQISAVKLAQLFLLNFHNKNKRQYKNIQIQTDPQKENVEDLRNFIKQQQKKLNTIAEEKRYLKQKMKEMSDDTYQFRKKVEQCEQIIGTNIKEISQMKTKYLHDMKKKEDFACLQKNRIAYLEKQIGDHHEKGEENDDRISDEVSEFNTEENQDMRKSWGNPKSYHSKNNSRYEKELQNQRKCNQDLGNSLELILSVLKAHGLIKYDARENFQNDILRGRFSEKAKIIENQLNQELLSMHKSRFSLENLKGRGSFKFTSQQMKEVGIQSTMDNFLLSTQAGTPLQNSFTINHKNIGTVRPDYLDNMKNEIIERAQRKKIGGTNAGTPCFVMEKGRTAGISTSHSSFTNLNGSKSGFSNKPQEKFNLHFEEIVIKKGDKKEERVSVKTNDKLFGIDGLETKTQANRIFKYIQMKNDPNNKFLRRFMKYLMEDIRRGKGLEFIELLLSDYEKKKPIKSSMNQHNRHQSTTYFKK